MTSLVVFLVVSVVLLALLAVVAAGQQSAEHRRRQVEQLRTEAELHRLTQAAIQQLFADARLCGRLRNMQPPSNGARAVEGKVLESDLS